MSESTTTTEAPPPLEPGSGVFPEGPWYYVVRGTRFGPFDEDQMLFLRGRERISDQTQVWTPGMPGWTPLKTLTDQGLLKDDPERRGRMGSCLNCGRPEPKEAMIRFRDFFICQRCKPEFLGKVEEGVPLPHDPELAGLGLRFLALVIDIGITMIVSFAMAMVPLLLLFLEVGMEYYFIAEIIGNLGQVVFGIFYYTWFVGRFGGTPGKLFLGLRIVTFDGKGIGYWRAFARYLASVASAMFLYLGYVVAFFDPERRTLHDHICNTLVVQNRKT